MKKCFNYDHSYRHQHPQPPAPLCEGQHCHRSNNRQNSSGINKKCVSTPLLERIILPVAEMPLRQLTPTDTPSYQPSTSLLITKSKIFSARISQISTFSKAQQCHNSSYFSLALFILILHDDNPVVSCILLKALHNHPSGPLQAFLQLVKMAVVVDNLKYDCSYSSDGFDQACSTNWERQSISVEQPSLRSDKLYTGVQWEMLENVYSLRKVETQVMTIARACETVEANAVMDYLVIIMFKLFR